jgi:cation diffusion facilitator CzcD-associated flavoprotein CzcO
MSDPSAEITARRVDTDVAVIGAGPAGLAQFGALKDPVAQGEGRPRS